MIGGLFLNVFQMSVGGTVVAVFALLAVALLRRLRAPQAAVFLLWAVVLARFLCPVSFTSGLSPLGIPGLRDYVARFGASADGYTGDFKVAVDIPGGSGEFERVTAAGIEPETTEFGFDAAYYEEGPDGIITPARTSRETQLPVLGVLWLCGVAVMAACGTISYLRLRGNLQFAMRTEEEGVWESDRISSPCVAGFLRPRVYLTPGLTGPRREHILCHERAHIRHGDHLWKLLAFLCLCVHWFNPYCWMLFRNFQEDLEIACDERVLRQLGEEAREDYGESLLALSTKPRFLSACPLAFGENSTRTRIRQVLRFRRPARWVAIPAAVAAAALAAVLLSNPVKVEEDFLGSTYRVKALLYSAPEYSFGYTAQTAPEFRVSADRILLKKETGRERDWESCGSLAKQHALRGDSFRSFFPDGSNQAFDPESIAGQNAGVYRVNVRNDPNRTFYLLLRQKGGGLLLAVGYDRPEGARARWLFELGAVAVTGWQAEIYGQRTEYIGNNSKVGGILSRLSFPKGMEYGGFELFTNAPPYGLSVHFKVDQPTRAALENGASPEGRALLKNAALLFALIENAGSVEFTFDGGEREPFAVRFTRDQAESTVGADLWRESGTPEGFSQLCYRLDRFAEGAAVLTEDAAAQ